MRAWRRFQMTVQYGPDGKGRMDWTGSYPPEDAEQIEGMLTAMRDGATEAGYPAEVTLTDQTERPLP